MTILLNQNELKFRKKFNTLTGKNFTAIVVANDDKLKSGRVKVRISLFHRNVDDDKLPWATPRCCCSTNGAYGGFSVPIIGSYVIVEFLDESGFNLIYENTIIDTSLPTIFKEKYGKVTGYVSSNGDIIIIDTDNGNISINHHSGSSITFSKNGDININCNNLNINSYGNISVKSSNIEESATNTINRISNNINDNSQDYKNISKNYIGYSNIMQLKSQLTDIQALNTINIASNITKLTGSTQLDLNGNNSNINSTQTNINGVDLTVNAKLTQNSPQPIQSDPVILVPEVPKQPSNPTNLTPLPTPITPDVKNKIDY